MAERPPALHNDEYTVGWICAITPELTASVAVLDVIHADPPPTGYQSRDQNAYIRGSIGPHNIIMACLPKGEYATASATVVARDMNTTFSRLEFCLMVGVGGGIPDKSTDVESIRLGDVVVGVPELDLPGVVKVDLVKKEADGTVRVGSLDKPPHQLLTAIGRIQGLGPIFEGSLQQWIDKALAKYPGMRGKHGRPEQEDILYDFAYDHNGKPGTPCDQCDNNNKISRVPRGHSNPVVHYGTIATGDAVIKNAGEREAIRQRYRAKCVEMEAAGVLKAISVRCLVIRGICDYSDTHKNKGWQGYAALAAAAYAKELLQSVSPQTPLRYNTSSPPFTPPYSPPLFGSPGFPPIPGNQNYFPAPLPTPPIPAAQFPTPSGSAASETYPEVRYSVAAIHSDSLGHRIWFQDNRGIFEIMFDDYLGNWRSHKLDILDAASYTPLTAVAHAGGEDLRLYYTTNQGLIQEKCWTASRGWSNGSLGTHQIRVAANSKITAAVSAGGSSIRIFYQGPESFDIQEYCYLSSLGRWEKGNVALPAALGGSYLAVAYYRGGNGDVFHIYYQSKQKFLREIIYNGSTFEKGELRPVRAPAHTPIAACAMMLNYNSPEVAMFWKSKDGVASQWSLPSKTIKEIQMPSFEGASTTVAAIASGSVLDFNRSLFVFKGGDALYEERWFADGDSWEEPQQILSPV
ncbi:hypothetical protein TWF481_004426 [Arthrobotrys musiformis]|uniref:Nucleoside phosphorylase domain-containing protein n=1 Tax=Arthrobotrys musiformis TaxID=47236 RepID=A0AAV9WLF5_9PEZI